MEVLLILFFILLVYVCILDLSTEKKFRRLNRRIRKLVKKYENIQKSEQVRRNK